jgi:ribonuclease-3
VRPDGARRDAKTELQEWAHAKFGVTPVYRVEERSGPDHDPRFTVTVEVAGSTPETGIDRSKRAAEQVAATRMLERAGRWQAPPAQK